MGLVKYKIGQLIEQYSERCGVVQHPNVKGINIDKKFVPSKNVGADTSKYLIVPNGHFACNLMHVGRDEKIPIAMNDQNENVVVSPAYFVFRVINEDTILKEYFYIHMNSPEFDRYTWFCTDNSVRGGLDWDRFCDIELDLPSIEVQQKYVNIYKAMVANQEIYEKGLDDLKLTCDAYIENLKHSLPLQKIGQYIKQSDERNALDLPVENVRGISIEKKFIPTKAAMSNVSLKNYKLVKPGQFSFVTVTSRNGGKISLALNGFDENYLVSATYIVFGVDEAKILPEFLMMFLSRAEFDRYSRFNSWGSARETFTWEDMQEVKIPIPEMRIQEDIVNIYNAYLLRKEMNETLKRQIKEICPILIKGSLEEAND